MQAPSIIFFARGILNPAIFTTQRTWANYATARGKVQVFYWLCYNTHMEIVFSAHALLKLRERGISQEFVLKAIQSPDFAKPTRNFREERYKRFGKNYLKVIAIEERGAIIVITAHWLAKFKKK
jgi:hypothetical protein